VTLGVALAALPAAALDWDPRLTDQMGVYWVNADPPPGTWYWRLVSGVYEDENQSGGNHNIYYKCLDQYGSPIENQACWAAYPTGSPTNFVTIYTKGSLDGYWGDFPMAGGWCPPWPEGGHGPYGAGAGNHDDPNNYTDEVWGMGMPCNWHVNYRYVWQWTQASADQPTIERTPSQISQTVPQGQDAASQTYQVRNSGSGTLNYTISDDRAWMWSVPSSGTSTGEWDTIPLVYDTDSLSAGQHTGTITISDPQATNTPQYIQVTLTVQAAAQTPPGFYKAGWNMTSVPVEPTNPEATMVFQDLVDLGNVITNNLYRYETGVGYESYSSDFVNIEQGRGYWLWLSTVTDQTVVSVSGQAASGTVALTLDLGWNLIGHPFNSAVTLSQCTIYNPSAGSKTLAQARTAGWIDMPLYYWGGSYQRCGLDPWDAASWLAAWRGYWLHSRLSGLELRVPAP